MTTAASIVRLVDVQRELESLKQQRDDLIREAVNGGAGIRQIARFLGMSPAQVSRISRRNA